MVDLSIQPSLYRESLNDSVVDLLHQLNVRDVHPSTPSRSGTPGPQEG